MQWFDKPKTMEEVQGHKKSAMQALVAAAVLLCILMLAGIVGFASKLISIVIGVLLGAGLVRWLQARKVEETLMGKEAAPQNSKVTANAPSVVPAPASQSQSAPEVTPTDAESSNNS